MSVPSGPGGRANLVHVLRLYRAVLGRDPDAGELRDGGGLMSAGSSAAEIGRLLLASDEGRGRGDPSAGGDRTVSRPAETADGEASGLDVLRVLFPRGVPAEDGPAYDWWREEIGLVRSSQLRAPPERAAAVHVHVLVHLRTSADVTALRRALASLTAQADPRWTATLILGPALALTRGVSLVRHLLDRRVSAFVLSGSRSLAEWRRDRVADDDLVCWLRPDDVLSRFAVSELVAAAASADLLSSDGDTIARDGSHRDPKLHGDGWDPDAVLTQPPSGIVAVKAGTFRAALASLPIPEEAAWDMLLRAAAIVSPARIRHLPAVLRHAPAAPNGRRIDAGGRASLVATVLAETGRSDRTVVPGQAAGTLRIVHALPARPPTVSVVVLTRDRAALLRTCIEGLLFRTAYPAIEIVVVDNGSLEPETSRLLSGLRRDHGITVLRDDGPFHWSALNHSGIAAAKGEVLLLLNNDTEIIHAGWLSEMVSHAVRPDVGLVGAKLLYPSGAIQHAGIAVDSVSAWHVWRHAPGDAPGYDAQLTTVRTVGAVTGACVACRRDVYEEVGGLERTHLAVTWGDVDLCFRVRRAGYRVVWTPHATLRHLEQATRGSDEGSRERARFEAERDYILRTWGDVATRDPFFSPHLIPSEPTATLRV